MIISNTLEVFITYVGIPKLYIYACALEAQEIQIILVVHTNYLVTNEKWLLSKLQALTFVYRLSICPE
jgi:uncharacterized membrane protein YciS (DUF1049 family)